MAPIEVFFCNLYKQIFIEDADKINMSKKREMIPGDQGEYLEY